MKVIILNLILIAALGTCSAATNKIFCYYGNWVAYRKNGLLVENIDPKLCTNIIYSFVKITPTGNVEVSEPDLDINKKGLEKLVALKKKNPKLKVSVAIGGYSQGSEIFSKVVSDSKLRSKFVENILKFVKTHKLDGFDLDWEYPAQRGGAESDKANFVKLVKELHEKFKPLKLLLTAAVGATSEQIEKSYNVKELSKYLDYINIMSYDLHGSWDSVLGQNSPLHSSSADSNKQLNIDYIIKNWIKLGAKPEKLNLGLAFYGRSFTLANPSNTKTGAPASGPGKAGPSSQEAGILSYFEICENIKKDKWKTGWDNEQKVPFAHKDNQWVGYDDPKSIKAKVEYAKKKKLGGVLIWSIEQDDYLNTCKGGKWPLLKAVNNGLKGGAKKLKSSKDEDPKEEEETKEEPTETTEATATEAEIEETTQSTQPTTPIPIPEGGCVPNSAVEGDCASFYVCDSLGNPIKMPCAPGTLFNPAIQVCDHIYNVKCEN